MSNYKGRTKTLSITSGKGGVGKTSVVVNLAYDLGQRGHRVLILDGDLGMANADIMFAVKCKYNLNDVLKGRKRLEEVIMNVAPNVYLIPGGSGIYGMSRLDALEKQLLLDQVTCLEEEFDYMLIDTAPGIEDHVLYLNSAAQEIVVVVTPDPSSLTDAYAVIKVLHQRFHESRFSILCNFVKDEVEALNVFKRLSEVSSQFLCVGLDYVGYIPLDPILRRVTKQQQLLRAVQPFSPAGIALRKLSEKICFSSHLPEAKGGIQFFWNHLSGVA